MVEHYEPVLGTLLEIQILGGSRNVPELARDVILGKIKELEDVFSIYKTGSEISKWNEMEVGDFESVSTTRNFFEVKNRPILGNKEFSIEFCTALSLALQFFKKSRGAFHPCAEILKEKWQREEFGMYKDELLAQLADQPYDFFDLESRKSGGTKMVDLTLNMNAVAKGLIIDFAVLSALRFTSSGMHGFRKNDKGQIVPSRHVLKERMELVQPGWGRIRPVKDIVVNIGGDLRHWGKVGVLVDVLDPNSNAANAEVISRVKVCNAGFATSGRAMRPIQIGDREISHVFDPRTGQPVDHWSGVSVISSSARLADILSTTLMVLSFDEGLELVSDMDGTEFLAVDRDGVIFTSPGWPELMR